jgi:hypothetical protein
MDCHSGVQQGGIYVRYPYASIHNPKANQRKGDQDMNEGLKITVRVRNIYGNRTVYPVCDKAKIFAQMAGHSTLTAATLDGIRRLGYLIEVEQERVEI